MAVHDEVDELARSGLQGRRSGRLAAQAVKIWAGGGAGAAAPPPMHGDSRAAVWPGVLFFDPAT